MRFLLHFFHVTLEYCIFGRSTVIALKRIYCFETNLLSIINAIRSHNHIFCVDIHLWSDYEREVDCFTSMNKPSRLHDHTLNYTVCVAGFELVPYIVSYYSRLSNSFQICLVLCVTGCQ